MTAKIQKILVPVDGSPAADHAVDFAARLAADTGAALTLMFAYELSGASMMGLGPMSKGEVQEAVDTVAARAFAHGVESAAKAGLTPTKQTVVGHPAAEIIDFAHKDGTDLIVMGSRGLSPMEGLLLGSVSEKVLRHAGCAVAIVR